MNSKRFATKLTKVMSGFGIICLLTGLLLSAVQMPVRADAGSVWTTNETCANPAAQNDNEYAVGEMLHIRGSGLNANADVSWVIYKPGTSDLIDSGVGKTDGTGYFCLAAHEIGPDENGVYKYEVSYTGGGKLKSDNYHVNGIIATPALSLDKTSSSTGFTAVGNTLSYSYLLTNTGTVPLLPPYTVSDNKASVICPAVPNPLAVGGTVTCTATHTISQADLDLGFVTNLATASAVYNGAAVTSNPDSVTISGTQTPAMSLLKTALTTSYSLTGETINYSYLLTNTGNVTLSSPFTVTDDKAAFVTCPATATLLPGASITCSAAYLAIQTDLDAGSVTNVATGSGMFNGNTVSTNQDQETVPAVQQPKLLLDKSVDAGVYDAVGDVLTYSYQLVNIGNVTLAGPFTVADDKVSVSCPATASLAPLGSITCTATHIITQADLDAGSITNLATGHGFFSNKEVTTEPDTVTVSATVDGPSLSLSKLVDPLTYGAAGVTLEYKYALTNSGDVTLTGPFTITDDKVSVTCPNDATLVPGASITCTAIYTITQADLDSGSVTNKATGHGFFGQTVVDSNLATATATAIGAPGLTLDKSVSPLTYDSVGDVLSYTYLLTNTGAVTLASPFNVTDDKATVTCPAGVTSLAVGASLECTASYVVTLADLNTGSVTNIATGSGSFNGKPVLSNEDEATAEADQNPALTLDKTSVDSGYVVAGDVLHYSYTLTNSGNVTLSGPFTVTDNKITGDIACPAVTLAPGAFTTCSANYTVTQADLDAGKVTNVAQGHVTYGGEEIDSNEDNLTITGTQRRSLFLDKTANDLFYNRVGQVLSYTYVMTNTGNVTLYPQLWVYDDKTGPATCYPWPASLAPGQSHTCTDTYLVTQADLDAGSVVNIAHATAHTAYLAGTEIHSNPDTATVPAQVAGPALSLVKDVTPGGYDSVGDTLAYTYTLTNTGGVTLKGPFTVTDDKVTVSCPATPVTLLPGQFITCTASYTIVQADLNAGKIVNIAQGHGFTVAGAVVNSNTDTETANAGQHPVLTLEKTVFTDPTTNPVVYGKVGDVLHYSYLLTNTGNVILFAPFTVDDDKTSVTCPATPTALQPGETITCTASYTITQADLDAGLVTNTAQGHGLFGQTPIDSNEDSATATANISGPALAIVKSVTETQYSLVGDVLHYSYQVTNIGDVTLWGPFKVYDDKSTDETCLLNASTDTLLPGASTTCTATYTVTLDDLINGAVTNIAYAEGFFRGGSILSQPDTETVEAVLVEPVVTLTADNKTTCAVAAGEECIEFTLEITGLTIGQVEVVTTLPVAVPAEPLVFTENGTYTFTVCGIWPGIEDLAELVQIELSAVANWVVNDPGQSGALQPVQVASKIATVTYDPANRLVCFPQVAPVYADPFCSLNDGTWTMAVNLYNPNDLPMNISWTIDGGTAQAGIVPAFSSIRLGNLGLGQLHNVAVLWGNGQLVELRNIRMENSQCVTPPPPPQITTGNPIPVTAVKPPAPVTEAVVLIPVTGVDLGNAMQTGLLNKLMIYFGLSFLGMAFITHSLRSRFK